MEQQVRCLVLSGCCPPPLPAAAVRPEPLPRCPCSFELPQSPHYGADGADGAPSLARSSDDPSGRRTPPGAAGDEAAAQKSWVRRVQAKTDELRVLFGLEPGEALMDDFMCALRKKVLLQGRLYVFERHLCFSSSLFGYHKTKVVPLEAVLDVRKRKNVSDAPRPSARAQRPRHAALRRCRPLPQPLPTP
jgi:hypothetical protein